MPPQEGDSWHVSFTAQTQGNISKIREMWVGSERGSPLLCLQGVYMSLAVRSATWIEWSAPSRQVCFRDIRQQHPLFVLRRQIRVKLEIKSTVRKLEAL